MASATSDRSRLVPPSSFLPAATSKEISRFSMRRRPSKHLMSGKSCQNVVTDDLVNGLTYCDSVRQITLLNLVLLMQGEPDLSLSTFKNLILGRILPGFTATLVSDPNQTMLCFR